MRVIKLVVLLISINDFLNPASAKISVSPYIALVDNGGGGGPTSYEQIKVPCWYRGAQC